jgi:hypothetical protein
VAFRNSAIPLSLVVAALAAGCGKPPARAPDRPEARGASDDYAAPPAVTEVRATATGVTVSGTAPAGVQVRLGAPGGAAEFTPADRQGRWRIALPASPDTRIFGLSEKARGRQVQAQGYVVVGPQGRAALLRAGAGAVRLDPQKPPALGALDFDHDGAAVVSGTAAPGVLVFVRLDGRQVAEGRSDAAGRYSVALPQPIPQGDHAIEAAGQGFSDVAEVEVSPAAPLVAGPMRSQFTKGGLRVDWMTPGGGTQSTLLLD